MEHKTWRWKRKPSEKFIVANGRASLSHVEEDQDKEIGSTRYPSNLSERSVSVICDCNAKEELIRKHMRIAELALAGQKMAEAEAAFLKQELDRTLQQGEAAEQRLAHLDAALKDCMQEIESLQAEQDGRIHKVYEKMQKKLEGKLVESNKRVSNLAAENSNLMKALLCKEKLIEDLDKGKAHLEAEYDMLIARSDSIEKENTFLKYDCSVMEEELKLQNEERDHSRRSASENSKQIIRLKAECQQLRDLIRKRLQVPAVGLNTRMRRKRLNPATGYNSSEKKPSKGTSFLIERVYDLEEENKALKEIVSLSGQMKLAISGFGVNNDERIDDSETWANALLAEVDQFSKGDIKFEPELMNDLDETNKLAIVTTDIAVNEPGKRDSWLDEVLKVILEEHRVSQRSFGDILNDIKIVVGCKEENHSNPRGLLPWKSSNSTCVEDASFAREKIRKLDFGFDRSKGENQLDVVSPNNHNTLAQMIKIQCALQEENRETKEKLQLVSEENVGLKEQLQESNQSLESLRRELDDLRETKGVIEEQLENQRLINEDLDTQLTVAKAKLNEILLKLSSLEVELEDKNNSCEELEATCLELQLQLETLSRKESPNSDIDQVTKKLKTEMIQNLGKQLNALASPDTRLFDKVLGSTTAIKAPASGKKGLAPQRSSLRDRMLAEDDDGTEDPKSHEQLKVSSSEHVGTVALVPSKKPSGGFGFIRKLFLRRKRGCNKMNSVPLQRNTSALIGPRDVLLLV